MDVRAFTVGPFQENTYVLRARRLGAGARHVDPGDEASSCSRRSSELGVDGRGDPAHARALRPRRRGRAAREGDRRARLLPEARGERAADIMGHVPMEGFGPYEGYDAEELVEGGEELELAGCEIEVVVHAGPQPGPRDLRRSPTTASSLSGDVLFQDSVGRTDLPRRRPPDAAGLDRHAARRAAPTTRSSARPHGHRPPSAASARRTRSWPSSSRRERADPGAARHVRRAARATRRRAPARRGAPRAASSRARATGASRRRPSRRPSCSRAASASRPTSSRRRCTPSRTRAGGR